MAITLSRPAAKNDVDIPRAVRLNTGTTVFPDAKRHHLVRVLDEDDAAELEQRGWQRDAASTAAKVESTALLRKGLALQLAHATPGVGSSYKAPLTWRDAPWLPGLNFTGDHELRKRGHEAQQARIHGGPALATGGGGEHARTEFGTVSTPFGTVVVAHERSGAGSLQVHGVTVPLNDLDHDLRDSLVATSSAFNSATTQLEQTSQRAIIGLIVSEALRRNQRLGDAVKNRLQHQRYD
jgi:hypothetical protein